MLQVAVGEGDRCATTPHWDINKPDKSTIVAQTCVTEQDTRWALNAVKQQDELDVLAVSDIPRHKRTRSKKDRRGHAHHRSSHASHRKHPTRRCHTEQLQARDGECVLSNEHTETALVGKPVV